MAVVGRRLFLHGGMAGSQFLDDLHVLNLGEMDSGTLAVDITCMNEWLLMHIYSGTSDYGTSYYVEVPFFGGYKCVSTIGK